MNENIKNEDQLLLEAIDNYDGYSVVEKKILKTIILTMINSLVIISPAKLAKLAKVSRPSVYPALKKFAKDDLIAFFSDNQEKFNRFVVNKVQLEEIVKRYNKERKIEFNI